MKIEKELKDRILSEFSRQKDHLLGLVENHEPSPYAKYITVPFIVDGVIDHVKYNLEDDRFDQIEVKIGTKDIAPVTEDCGYASEYDIYTLQL